VTAWTLRLKSSPDQRVDASPIQLALWNGQTVTEVAQTELNVGRQKVCLGDLFSLTRTDCEDVRLVIEGDLSGFDRIGERHSRGLFRVTGAVGHHAGGSMSGGCLLIQGDAGNHLGAPCGAARLGMRGGRIIVGGSAGDYAGHRMRRGEILVEGDVGRFAASQMVAGTIVVAGEVSSDAATAMRRGTLIAAKFPDLPTSRFSVPVPIRSVFPSLYDFSLPTSAPVPSQLKGVQQLMHQIVNFGFQSRRGDMAVNGKGEILTTLGRTETP
tara:strand:+ start:959765 stop:960571 length:807 start_codon:yes stop_codon:yes gene_type:complete